MRSFFGGGGGFGGNGEEEEERVQKGHSINIDLFVSLTDLYVGKELKVRAGAVFEGSGEPHPTSCAAGTRSKPWRAAKRWRMGVFRV